MLAILFWLLVGLLIGTVAGAVLFVLGMALVYLFVDLVRLFDQY